MNCLLSPLVRVLTAVPLPGTDRWQLVIALRPSAGLLLRVSWLLACIPGLLMLSTFGLERPRPACIAGPAPPREAATFLEQAVRAAREEAQAACRRNRAEATRHALRPAHRGAGPAHPDVRAREPQSAVSPDSIRQSCVALARCATAASRLTSPRKQRLACAFHIDDELKRGNVDEILARAGIFQG